MNWKSIFHSISNKIHSDSKGDYSNIRLGLVLGVFILVLVCFLVWGINSDRTGQTMSDQSMSEKSKEDAENLDPKELLNEYFLTIDNYNKLVENYNVLVEGLSERHLVEDALSFEKKENEIGEIQDKETIGEHIQQINDEDGKLENEYMSNGIAGYNAAVLMYNLAVEKIGSYQLSKELTVKVEKPGVSEYNTDWNNTETYFKTIDSLLWESNRVKTEFNQLVLETGNEMIDDYNLVADDYNLAVENAVVTYISGVPNKVIQKKELKITDLTGKTDDELFKFLDEYNNDNKKLVENYIIVKQITAPQEPWVKERLANISDITGMEAVTKTNDPNGLLGKNGGYSSCIYFTVEEINAKDIPGESIVDMGTDAGGAVEIYNTREDALNRSDYLSQFDGTVLYTGSYTVVGTIVIRTSYKLNDEQQGQLTDSIITKFSEIQ